MSFDERARDATPPPDITRSSSLPETGTEARPVSSSPSPASMSMSDAEWLRAVRSCACSIYYQARRHPLPVAKQRKSRVPLECDGSDAAADTPAPDEPMSEEEIAQAAKAAARVSLLFQRLSLHGPFTRTSTDKTSEASSCEKDEKDEKDDKDEEEEKEELEAQKPLDWSAPGALERFLERCVEGFEMQSRYLAQQATMQRAMERMQRRLAAAEDETALMAWYANHLQGSAAPLTPASTDQVLREAEAAVLAIAAQSVEETTQT